MSYLLTIIILLPIAGAVALMLAGKKEATQKWVALVFSLATFVISLELPIGFGSGEGLRFEQNVPWISAFDLGVRYHVGIDGLSLWLVLLTT